MLVLLLVALSACTATVRPVLTSPEQKVWLVRGVDEIFRCADAGGVDQPPRPVCVKARVVEAGQ
jgi:hypothetical protein